MGSRCWNSSEFQWETSHLTSSGNPCLILLLISEFNIILIFHFICSIQIIPPGYDCCQVIWLTQSLNPCNEAVFSPPYTPSPFLPLLWHHVHAKEPNAKDYEHAPHSFLFVGLVFCRFHSLNWLIEMPGRTRDSSRKQRENVARAKERRRNRRAELPLIVTISH